MKYHDNILEVAVLQPDYLGFIFYEKSLRYFDGIIPKLPDNIKKTGVFVDETIETIIKTCNKHRLKAIQLHGNESSQFCSDLKVKLGSAVEIIKVFSVKKTFDFEMLKPYEACCDYFLFDTKGKLPGGNGYAFDWNALKQYPSTKPYFLSGGIGLDKIYSLKQFLNNPASALCLAIDVNSKFEVEAGLKNIDDLKAFFKEFRT